MFFINGSQRSGTTLLANLLDKHPDIYVGKDTVGFRLVSCFLNYREVISQNFEYDWNEVQAWMIENDYKGRLKEIVVPSTLSEFDDARSAISSSIKKLLKNNNKKIFGDKTPNMEAFVNDALSLIPNAKFIHIIRDGRSVASSLSKRGHKNLYLAAHEWVNSVSHGLYNRAVLGTGRYKLVNYEELVSNPEMVLRDICLFLDVDYSEEMLLYDARESKNQDQYVKPYFDHSRIASFETDLKPKQIKGIEEIQGQLLVRLGYKLVEMKRPIRYHEISIMKLMYYRQKDNFNQLFRAKRLGMRSRSNLVVLIPLKVRLRTFILSICRDFLPTIIFSRIASRRRNKNVKYKGK